MDLCEECNTDPPYIFCFECEQCLCPICDSQLHRGGNRKFHTKQTLCFTCKELPIFSCASCSIALCGPCSISHLTHALQQIAHRKTVGIYWDFDRNIILEHKDIEQTWAWIEKKIENVEFLKVYGEGCHKWKAVLDNYGAEYVHVEGMKEDEAIFIDISMTRLRGIREVLLLSQNVKLADMRLGRIQLGMPNVKIFVSGFPDLKPEWVARNLVVEPVEQVKDLKELEDKALLKLRERPCTLPIQEVDLVKSEASITISKNHMSIVGDIFSKLSDDDSIRINREPGIFQVRISTHLSWKFIWPFIRLVIQGLTTGQMIQVLKTQALFKNKHEILLRAKEIFVEIPSLFWCCVKNVSEGAFFRMPIYRESPSEIGIKQVNHNFIRKGIYEFVIFIVIKILCLYCEYWGAREKDIKSGFLLDANFIEGCKQHIKKLHKHLAALITAEKLKRLNLSTL